MYITKRDGKYRAWERVVGPDGKVRKISVTMDRDTPQSRKKAAAQLARKIVNPENNLRYDDLVDYYIEYQKTTMKQSTWSRNEASLKRLSATFGNAKLSKMTAGFISSRLLKKTKNPTTYNEYLKRIKAMFRWAYQMDYIESSACVDKVRPLKDLTEHEKVSDKYLEADELKKVLEASGEYYSAVFEFLALSGLRIGELIALDDKDVTNTDIIVNKTYDFRHDTLSTPKTAFSIRSVHIQPELRSCIQRIRTLSNLHRMISGSRVHYFVVSATGDRLSYNKANRRLKSICKRVVNKDITLHALRHTHVALMASAGADLDQIARRIGHGDSRITKEIYFHLTEKQREKDNATFDSISIFA